jgi:hypothetical protein
MIDVEALWINYMSLLRAYTKRFRKRYKENKLTQKPITKDELSELLNMLKRDLSTIKGED